MYAGKIVETATTQVLFDNPKHPYTLGLMASVPVLGQLREQLDTIPGNVPNLVNLPAGCRFASRCQARLDHNLEICTLQEPDLIPTDPGHEVRCWLYQTPPEGNQSSALSGESKFGRREAK